MEYLHNGKKVKPKKVHSPRLSVEEIQRRERARQAWAAGEEVRRWSRIFEYRSLMRK